MLDAPDREADEDRGEQSHLSECHSAAFRRLGARRHLGPAPAPAGLAPEAASGESALLAGEPWPRYAALAWVRRRSTACSI